MFALSSRTQRSASFLACSTLVFGLSQAALAAPVPPAPDAPGPDRVYIEAVLKGLNRGRSVGQVAVSPDGKRVAWIEGGRTGGAILISPLDDLKKTERITAAAKPD